MFKKLKLPALVLGAALMLSPGVGLAREHEREEHEHHRRHFSVYFGAGPSYYSPNYYANGYYDQWGYWHPYAVANGYYDRWGRWHSYGGGYYDRWGAGAPTGRAR